MTFIDSLPNEILILILQSLIDEDGEFDTRTSLALVSKGWHTFVYNTPSFWMKISSNRSPSSNTLALTRSRNLPLDINISLYNDQTRAGYLPGMVELFKAAESHLPRWRTATIELGPDVNLVKLLTRPAPRLECICLKSRRSCVVDLFGGQAERLTSVSLTDISIPWGSTILSGLHDLEISWIDQFPPTVEELLKILAACPLLHSFILGQIRFPTFQAPPVPSSVHLPHLQKLWMDGNDAASVQYLLENIHPGPSSCIDLSVNGAGVILSRFIPTISPFIPSFTTSTPGPAMLDVGVARVIYALHSPAEGRNLHIELNGGEPSRSLPILRTTLPPDFLKLDTIATIDVSQVFASSVDTYIAVVNMMRVTVLHLFAYDIDTGLECLGEMEQVEGVGRIPRFLPAMRELHVDIDEASPGVLSRMVRARCDESLAVRLTALHVQDRSQHLSDREAVQAIPGLDVTWEWSTRSDMTDAMRSNRPLY